MGSGGAVGEARWRGRRGEAAEAERGGGSKAGRPQSLRDDVNMKTCTPQESCNEAGMNVTSSVPSAITPMPEILASKSKRPRGE